MSINSVIPIEVPPAHYWSQFCQFKEEKEVGVSNVGVRWRILGIVRRDTGIRDLVTQIMGALTSSRRSAEGIVYPPRGRRAFPTCRKRPAC